MTPVRHHGTNEEAVHSDTRLVRWTDIRTCNWISTTQVWSFDGGDAIVVVTGTCPNTSAFTVLRIGEKVHVVEASLSDSMKAFGLTPQVN